MTQAEGEQPPATADEELRASRAVHEADKRPATDSIADGIGVRSSYAVTLDVFEGPLDLLLHLVRRHELDILDIPIAFITEKYIEYITLARALDIEVAGEYLLMAATLAFLKSRELLPPTASEDDEEGEEEEGVDPREELIRRLIEYERFRDAGFELSNRPLAGRDVFPRGGDLAIQAPEPGLAPVTLFRLAEAYNRVLDRAKIREDHEVVLEPVTVRTRMHQLSLLLAERPRVGFEELFLSRVWSSERELRQMLVVTLMSVLEMVKLGILGVHQASGSESIELERAVEVREMRSVVAAFRGDDEPEEDAPAEGSEDAVEASEDAVEPADAAAEGSEDAAEPSDVAAAEGSEDAAEPSDVAAAEGSEDGVEPSDVAVEGSEDAVDASEGAVDASEGAVDASEDAADPSEDAAEASDDSAEPSEDAEPIEAAAELSEETTDAVEPSDDTAAEPSEDAADPAEQPEAGADQPSAPRDGDDD